MKLTDEEVMAAAEDVVARHYAVITGDHATISAMDAINEAIRVDCSAAAVHLAGEAAEAFASGVNEKDFLSSMTDLMEDEVVAAAVGELKRASFWPW